MEKEKGMTERERERERRWWRDGGGEARRSETRRGEARLVRTGGGGSVADGRLGRYERREEGGGRAAVGEGGVRTGRKGRSYRVDWK